MSTGERITLPAPQIDPGVPPLSKWQREYEAFSRLLPQLLQTHRGQSVVIHEGRVVDSGPDEPDLALQFFTRDGNVPVHIGLVTDQPETAVRIPRYREVSRPRGPS